MAAVKQLVRPAIPVRRIGAATLWLFLLFGCAREDKPSVIGIHLGSAELQMISQGIYDVSKLPFEGKTPAVPVIIIPHHLTASVTIAAGIESLAAHNPESILLVSPDHFDSCDNFVCTGYVRFLSSLGETEPDEDVINILRSSKLVSKQDGIFRREHGIRYVVPFISKMIPAARVTPLVVAMRPDWKAHGEELLELFKRTLGENKVLVVSSDFSHYLSLAAADEADERTSKALFSRDFEGIEGLNNPSQSDCPLCLWLAAGIADWRNAYNPSVLLHTNSARLLKNESAPSTTSHFAIAFYKNSLLSPDDAAFAGDVTLTRAGSGSVLFPMAGARSFWDGSGPRIVNLEGPLNKSCASSPNPFIFCNPLSLWSRIKSLATHWGIENNHKFDHGEAGLDETLSILEREGEVSISDAGTLIDGMKVYALSGFMNPVEDKGAADIRGQYERVTKALRLGSGSGIAQVVFVHAGTEHRALVSEPERDYLRSFIDNGAAAVIAAHSHVLGDMEIYKGAPIFRGIGNFVFDQRDSLETSTAKAVRLRPSEKGMMFETVIAR